MSQKSLAFDSIIQSLPKTLGNDRELVRWLRVHCRGEASATTFEFLTQLAHDDLCKDLTEWLLGVREQLNQGAVFTDIESTLEVRRALRLLQEARFPWRVSETMRESVQGYLEGADDPFPEA